MNSVEDAWYARWFLLFEYERDSQNLSPPKLYEENADLACVKRSKFLPEMVGLVDKIEEVKNNIFANAKSMQAVHLYASTQEAIRPAFLFDFNGAHILSMAFAQRRICIKSLLLKPAK